MSGAPSGGGAAPLQLYLNSVFYKYFIRQEDGTFIAVLGHKPSLSRVGRSNKSSVQVPACGISSYWSVSGRRPVTISEPPAGLSSVYSIYILVFVFSNKDKLIFLISFTI